MREIYGGGKDKSSGGTAKASEAGFFDKLIGTMRFAMKYFLGEVDPNLISNLDKRWQETSPFTSYTKDFTSGLSHGTFVLKFPYVLYY